MTDLDPWDRTDDHLAELATSAAPKFRRGLPRITAQHLVAQASAGQIFPELQARRRRRSRMVTLPIMLFLGKVLTCLGMPKRLEVDIS